MLKKVAVQLSPNYEKLKNSTVFWLLLVVTIFIRFPFFFRDYVDRDESTFVLVAQSWVDGHLPYTELWDLKPPIIFLFFAGIIYLFGKSFFAIRLAGALMVALTSWFVFKIGLKTTTKKIALWAALFTIILESLFGSLQGVMSEHICIAFFAIALYLVLFKKNWVMILLSGVFFGLSLMSKLNVAYPILFLFLYFFWESFNRRSIKSAFFTTFFLGLGISIVVVATAVPYLLNNELSLWWQSVFMAPMAYSSSKPSAILKVVVFFLLVSGWLLVSFKKGWLDFKKREIRILAAVSFGILFSFLQTGKFNGHYLILLYPTLLILILLFISKIKWPEKLRNPMLGLFILVLIPVESYLEYANIIKNKVQKGSFYNGEGIDVPKYLEANGLDRENTLFFEYHIGYWKLDQQPPTKAATHPSNILRESIFPFMQNPRKTGIQELRYIMEDKRPSLVITRQNRRVFDKAEVEANTYINDYLSVYYTKLDSVDAAIIHKRLK